MIGRHFLALWHHFGWISWATSFISVQSVQLGVLIVRGRRRVYVLIDILMLWWSLTHVAPFMTHEIAVDLVCRGTSSPMWRTNSIKAIILGDMSLASDGYQTSTLLFINMAMLSWIIDHVERCEHLLFTLRLIRLIFSCSSDMNCAEKVLGVSIGLVRAYMRWLILRMDWHFVIFLR